MAGQFVMEGFLELKLPFLLRMIVTRGIALIPAIAVSLMQSEFAAMNNLSQSLNILQSVQLPFALLPLLHFCRLDRIMSGFEVGGRTLSLAWVLAVAVMGVNAYMLSQQWDTLVASLKLFWASLGIVYVVFIVWILKDDLVPAKRDREVTDPRICKPDDVSHCEYHAMPKIS
jgi:natural resistance-associated macrophage protein